MSIMVFVKDGLKSYVLRHADRGGKDDRDRHWRPVLSTPLEVLVAGLETLPRLRSDSMILPTPQKQAEDIFNDYIAILTTPGKGQDQQADEFLVQAIASALTQREQKMRAQLAPWLEHTLLCGVVEAQVVAHPQPTMAACTCGLEAALRDEAGQG